MNFLSKIFKIEDQSKLIEEKFQLLQEKVLAEVATLRAENGSLKLEVIQKDSRITELLGKVRNQNEADLLLECKKIEKRILEGEKQIESSALNQMQAMQSYYNQQMANQQNMAGLPFGTGRGLFG